MTFVVLFSFFGESRFMTYSSEKREFAIDALRGVLAFLLRHGYRIEKDEQRFELKSVRKLFV
jgi:hypothetical protein